jgi:hypothetical protein
MNAPAQRNPRRHPQRAGAEPGSSQWDSDIPQQITDYIAIPAKSLGLTRIGGAWPHRHGDAQRRDLVEAQKSRA